jgi:sialic acid synthase
MRKLVINDLILSDDSLPFVIAEIGNNHQGNLDTAIELIHKAAEAGVSAVKFQKRNNQTLFTPQSFNEPYNSENSFGHTYGQHREFLEFDKKDYEMCRKEAKKLNITFFATAFDFESAYFLKEIGIELFKVASGDLQNLPLLEQIAKFNKPMIISTGGSNFEMINEAVNTIKKHHQNFAILQCTSSYPAKYTELNLRVIQTLREKYPENIIGFSGHDNGIAMSLVAYALGAQIIEKHFTLDRTFKGTDHAFSLEPQGLKKLIRDLNRASGALGDGNKIIYESELNPIKKMGKSIIASRLILKGEPITSINVEFRSPGIGLPPSFIQTIVGKTVKHDIQKFSPILFDDLEN